MIANREYKYGHVYCTFIARWLSTWSYLQLGAGTLSLCAGFIYGNEHVLPFRSFLHIANLLAHLKYYIIHCSALRLIKRLFPANYHNGCECCIFRSGLVRNDDNSIWTLLKVSIGPFCLNTKNNRLFLFGFVWKHFAIKT